MTAAADRSISSNAARYVCKWALGREGPRSARADLRHLRPPFSGVRAGAGLRDRTPPPCGGARTAGVATARVMK